MVGKIKNLGGGFDMDRDLCYKLLGAGNNTLSSAAMFPSPGEGLSLRIPLESTPLLFIFE